MNCNVHVFYILIFSNKFEFILETVFSYTCLKFMNSPPTPPRPETCSMTGKQISSPDRGGRGGPGGIKFYNFLGWGPTNIN